ncbi:MAG: serine hydrolase domain-containing protein [Sedimentisphaerales bacterium]|nr:serine hydrolase domain-containing protein [Sedimentisphaerales bacterium]HNY78203.1 serine hydrolase domain-containing protein [Sedimentisphaerales bacterium]HOC65372.1 serine hydrolase domain-containing protein [Sedimentisphaerales bacterium]HOH63241.1 serine hydrolase domain-containing protein [Sedimentisphaerales bacterium]HPY51703.1 serine hydrolase domain-containing protein [Sedimentisphaerales bacterium]
MRLKRAWVVWAVVTWLAASTLWAAEIPSARPEEVGLSSARLAEMQAVARKMVDEREVAGIITLVARKGKVCHFEAYGSRDLAAGKPIQRDTILRFYSMSKPVTSVAAMILHEQGKVLLDEPVELYIPELRGWKVYAEGGQGQPTTVEPTRKVTVRDLLRHTSGLTYGIFGDTPVDRMYREKEVLSDIELKEMVKRLGEIPLLHQPGTTWHYSVSTDVLGHVIERASGQTLDVFFAQNIFKPLDMRDTGFYIPKDKHERFAVCYGPGSNGGLEPTNELGSYAFLEPRAFLSGGGGLVSTARDYLRFCQMLLNKGTLNDVRILRPETVEMMTRDQLPPGVSVGEGVGFGLGFSVRLKSDPSGAARVGEYGWSGAASTFFGISPDDESIVMLLTQYMPYSETIPATLKPLVYAAFNGQN